MSRAARKREAKESGGAEMPVVVGPTDRARTSGVAPKSAPFTDLPVNWIFRQIPGAAWATDRSLRITHGVGRTAGDARIPDAVGSTIQQFAGATDPTDPVLVHHLAALDGRSSSFRYPFGGRWYEVLVEPLRDARAEIVGTVGVAVDITERRAAEERRIETETRLAETQRMAHVGSWEWLIAADSVSYNAELARIYGFESDALRSTPEKLLERLHPEDAARVKDIAFRALREGRAFDLDHRIVRPDGGVRMLHTHGEVVFDDHGARKSIVGSSLDVTDRWESTRDKERTLSLLQATLESTADGLLVVDLTGTIRAFNQRFVTMWRLSRGMLSRGRDEVALSCVLDQLEEPEPFRQRVRELYGEPDAESFDVIRFKDGRVFERYSQPQSIGRETVGRVWSFRDVTERYGLLQRAQFLADASRLLATLDVERALEGVAGLAVRFCCGSCAIDLLSQEGSAHRVSVTGCEPAPPPFGELPRGALAGHAEIYPLGTRSALTVPLSTHGRLFGAITFVAHEGRRCGRVELELAQELGRRIELALENARLYRGAQDALAVRDEFLSIAAHEIRGPVTAIQLAAQTLRRRHDGDGGVASGLDVIEREGRRLARFVDEMLDVAQVRSGRLGFEIQQVDLVEITRSACAQLGDEVARAGTSLSVTTPGSVVGLWDGTRLGQVVTNLVSNAIKFGNGKPIEVSLEIDGEKARLAVTDHGIGIAPERQSELFQPFARAVSSRHYGGLGLGLYIVETIVRGLGGTVRLESEPGAGTSVTVELPLERALP